MKQGLAEYYTVNTTLVRGKDFGFPAVDRISQETLYSASRLDWHSHKSIEVIVCLKGVLVYELRGRGIIRIPGGSFTVIPVGLEHRHVRGLAEPGRRFGFFLTPSLQSRRQIGPLSCAELREISAELLKKRLSIRPLSASLLTEIRHLADLTMTWTSESSILTRILLRARVFSVLVQLSNIPAETSSAPEVKMMDAATRWLSDHYRKRVNINELIRFIGYGRSRFFSLFQQNTGLTPNEWLIRYRLNRAQELLSEKTLSIAQIADSCGFNDAVFFSRIFKNRLGLSPRDFRKQL